MYSYVCVCYTYPLPICLLDLRGLLTVIPACECEALCSYVAVTHHFEREEPLIYNKFIK
jgi:hypothetical protein